MAEFSPEFVRRSVGDAAFARYVLAARQRLLAGRTATLREIRALYREAAQLLADDLRRIPRGAATWEIRNRLRERIETRTRELSSRVLQAVTRGIHLGARVGVEPFAAITVDLTRGLVDGMAVERAFTALAERTALAQVARVGRDGLRLSDRVWRIDAATRAELERLVQAGTLAGWDPRRLAKEVERFLQPGVGKPHRLELQRRLGVGQDVSYQAMRLARTELAIAQHEAAIAAAAATPGVELMAWHLSRSHAVPDVCDRLAAASPYPVDRVPPRPHPNCWCYVTPVLPGRQETVDRLIAWVRNPASDPTLERWWSNLRPLLGAGPRPVIRLTAPAGTTATLTPGPGARLADVAQHMEPGEVWRSLTLEVDSLMADAAVAEGVQYAVQGWVADGPTRGPVMDGAFGFTHLRPGGAPVTIAGEIVEAVTRLLREPGLSAAERTVALRGLRTLLHEASHQLRQYGSVTMGDLAVLRFWGAGFVVEEGATDLLAVLRLPDFAARLGVTLSFRPWSYASPAYRPFARFIAGLAGLAGRSRPAEMVAWVHEWRTDVPVGWWERIARSIVAAQAPEAGEADVQRLAARLERAAEGIRRAWAVGSQFAEAQMREEMRTVAAWVRARKRWGARRAAGVRA